MLNKKRQVECRWLSHHSCIHYDHFYAKTVLIFLSFFLLFMSAIVSRDNYVKLTLHFKRFDTVKNWNNAYGILQLNKTFSFVFLLCFENKARINYDHSFNQLIFIPLKSLFLFVLYLYVPLGKAGEGEEREEEERERETKMERRIKGRDR